VLVSVGIVLFSGWLSPAYAYEGLASVGSTLVAQVDPESNFVTEAVDKVESAVVQVNVSRSLGGDVPDVLKPFVGGARGVPPSGQILRGLGSGFVIDPTGLILTNAHVVDEADTVTVSFQDGRILAGKVLGKDPVTDVAVIQVQAENNLPTVVIGDSDQVRQGQWANASGQVQHPYIGIQMVALNPQVRQQINNAPNSKIQVENDQGLLVVSVGRGTPAAKAGLQAGDVIEAINSEPVTKANLVQRLVDKAGVGGNLQMDVRRNRQTVALTVEPEQLPNIQSR